MVVALFSFTQGWNEFLYAFVFTSSLTSRTLTVGLTLCSGAVTVPVTPRSYDRSRGGAPGGRA